MITQVWPELTSVSPLVPGWYSRSFRQMRAAAGLPADRPLSGEGHARADRVVGIGSGRDRGRARARGCEAAGLLAAREAAVHHLERAPAPPEARHRVALAGPAGGRRLEVPVLEAGVGPPRADRRGGVGRAGRAGRDGAGLEPVRAVGHLEAGLRRAGLEGAAVERALERGAARSRGERELGRSRAVGTRRPGGDGGVRSPGGQRRADREGERARRECGEQHERSDARLSIDGFLPESRQRSVPIPFEVPNRKYMRFRVFAWTRAAACRQRPGQAWSRKVAFATSGGSGSGR